jgi:hypothetical protein
MTNQLIYRIYSKNPKHANLLLGTVIAVSAELALEKAKRDEWNAKFFDPARENDQDNWQAMV